MTSFTRVAILWAVVLAVFAAFTAVWLPVHRHQVLHDPANFIDLALKLDESDPVAAQETLRTGIDRFHPPVALPYERLADRAGAKEIVSAQGAFYAALQSPVSERTQAVAEAGQAAFQQASILAPGESARSYMDTCLQSLAAALDLGSAATSFSYRQKAGLLWLVGGGELRGPEIGRTGVRSPVDIVVYSAGGANGRRGAHLLLRGRDYGGRARGIHVAIIDVEVGQVAQLGVFDLWEDSEEAGRMVAFLEAAPAGSIAAFAVSDDSSLYVTPELEVALMGFGLERQAWINRQPRLYGLRYSFAAIGVKGAAEGTAVQAWSPAAFELDGRRYPGHPVVVGVLGAEGDER